MNNEERLARAAAKHRKAEALGRRLETMRNYRGYSQTALARRAGVPRQLLSMLEHGRRSRPEPATVEKLAAALGLRVAQLRGQEVIPELAALAGLEERAQTPEAPEPESSAPAEAGPPSVPLAPAPDYVTSLGLLPALPPGTTVIQRRNPDGSTEVYLHIPSPGEPGNPDATTGG